MPKKKTRAPNNEKKDKKRKEGPLAQSQNTKLQPNILQRFYNYSIQEWQRSCNFINWSTHSKGLKINLQVFQFSWGLGWGGVGWMQIVPVVSMNCSIFECSNCVFHKSRFIQCISVDINLLNLAGRIGDIWAKSYVSSLWKSKRYKRETWMSYCSPTVKQLSIAAGVVPQSSWSFSPIAPALTISWSPSGLEPFP